MERSVSTKCSIRILGEDINCYFSFCYYNMSPFIKLPIPKLVMGALPKNIQWDESCDSCLAIFFRKAYLQLLQLLNLNTSLTFPAILGQHLGSNRVNVRLASGAWCVGCFFLVQIYCSTLTSHLMAQNQLPIINSFFEIADTPGVHLTFDRGMGLDAILQQVGVVTYAI